MHDQQRIEQLVLLFLLTLGGFWIWRNNLANMLARIPRLAMRAWLLGLALGAVSALTAEHVRFAGLEWASLVLLSLGAAILANQSREQGNDFDRWAVRIVLLVAFFIALRALVNYGLVLYSGFFIEAAKLFASSFGNPRFFGQAATLLLPLLAYPLLSGNLPPTKRIALFGLLAVFWMLAIASGTRGTFLGLATASVALIFVSWRYIHRWLFFQISGFLVGLAIFALLFIWLPDVAQHPGIAAENRLANPLTLSKRETVWILAWQQIVAHPWLGIGPMHLAAIPNPVATHPHNALLQLGAEWGIPATLALIAPLAYGMGSMLRRIRQAHGANTPLMASLAASLLASAAQALVDGVIVMPYTQTLLVFVIGWTVGTHFRNTDPASLQPPSRTKLIAVALLGVLALGLTIWGVVPEIFHRAEITRELLNQGVAYFKPRYWMHGWIP